MVPFLSRAMATLAPVRWWRTLYALVNRVRVHPQAVLIGIAPRLRLGHGCKLGPRVKLDVGHAGSIEISEGVWVAADVEMQTETAVVIGAGTTVQRRCTINGSTRLGVGCILAPDVFISSGTHPFRSIPHLPIREQERRLVTQPQAATVVDRPVWVQDDCWLGVHVVICPGVTVGKGSVVGANSVVTRDVRPYSVVAGNPAHRVGTRLDWRPPSRLTAGSEVDAPYWLNGYVCRDEGGASCVRITTGALLLAALNAGLGLRGVAIEYQATGPMVLSAGGLPVLLSLDKGRIELALDHLRVVDGVVYCELTLLPASEHERLDVLSLESLYSP